MTDRLRLCELARVLVGLDHVARIIHRKRESRHHVNAFEIFAYLIALLTAFGSAYHSAPNGSTSEIRSTPRLSLRGSTS